MNLKIDACYTIKYKNNIIKFQLAGLILSKNEKIYNEH